MSELQFGALLLFLVPGLLSYCALYGLFQPKPLVAQAPPPANSIESLTIILCGALITQAITAALIVINTLIAKFCVVFHFGSWTRYLDLYGLFGTATDGHSGAKPIDGGMIEMFIFATIVQSVFAYVSVWLLLVWRTHQDRLPIWLYGWAAELANSVDDDDQIWLATVLTNLEVGNKSLLYSGFIADLHVRRDGTVLRITLKQAERYLADLEQPRGEMMPLSKFPLMIIDGPNIRNVAFEKVRYSSLGAAPQNPTDFCESARMALMSIGLDAEAERIRGELARR